MTFDEIRKNCVIGKTVFTAAKCDERLYIGISHGFLLTDYLDESGIQKWNEWEITDWKVKQPKRKLYIYEDTGNGEVRNFLRPMHFKYLTLLREEEF